VYLVPGRAPLNGPSHPQALPFCQDGCLVDYGDASKYMKIFEANKDQLKNPDLIKPGQTLRIPD
jgi:hypothetical protein